MGFPRLNKTAFVRYFICPTKHKYAVEQINIFGEMHHDNGDVHHDIGDRHHDIGDRHHDNGDVHHDIGDYANSLISGPDFNDF